MKHIKFLLIGVLFGVVMTKSEAISWYRIQEMFRFQSFHMYGIIGSALFVGVIMMYFINKNNFKSVYGAPVMRKVAEMGVYRYLFGGTVFGLGWALSGACPGPMYVLVGNGVTVFVIVILSAVVGTLCYGVLKKYLPH